MRVKCNKNHSFIKFMTFRLYDNYSVTIVTSSNSLYTATGTGDRRIWDRTEFPILHSFCALGVWENDKSSCKSLVDSLLEKSQAELCLCSGFPCSNTTHRIFLTDCILAWVSVSLKNGFFLKSYLTNTSQFLGVFKVEAMWHISV